MSMKVQQAKRAAEAGFTLIELMIVIAIIGILAAIAIPQYEQYIVTSKATTIAQDFKQMITQSTAAVAAASAGQTTSINVPASMTGGYGIKLTGATQVGSVATYTPKLSNAGTGITVTMTAGTDTGLNTAVAAALSGMNLQGSGKTGAGTSPATKCTAGACTVVISPNGGLKFS